MCTGAYLGLTLGQCLLDGTRLASIPVQACTPGSLPLLDMSTKHCLRVRFQYHVLHMVHLSYLNEMQQCICINIRKTHDAIQCNQTDMARTTFTD